MNVIRILSSLYCRIRNRISRYSNRIKLHAFGIKTGRNCIIHGKIYLRLRKTSRIMIGNNLYLSSGWNINALCANRRASFSVLDNAEIIIGDNCGMSSPIFLCRKKITIGNNVKLGGNVVLIDTNSHNLDYKMRRHNYSDHAINKPITIEDDVLVGANSIILKGVTVGARSIIGAGSVVTKNIPPDCIAAGNPAKVIKRLETEVS